MTNEELFEKLKYIQNTKCETSTLEIKSANKGCPTRLYDTLSSFSNQDDGGIIIFGVDEKDGFKEVGVYDPQDLQNEVSNQCKQMEPVVRPLMTIVEKDGKSFVSAEIPSADITDRPVFYQGKGRLKGSYIRVGDHDEPMTEYEVYSYEAYRKKYQDDIRIIGRASFDSLDKVALVDYLNALKLNKPNLSNLSDEMIYDLMSVKRGDEITLASVLIFCPYPQAFFPQLCIIATVVPGVEVGELGSEGERFMDNMRIEGSIPEMVDGAMKFLIKNMKTKTVIEPNTGKREDRYEFPLIALREAVINALVHRDYSIHTEGMPVQIIMYSDRIEIKNPGGIYGRIRVDQLGKVQPDTRNPVLATELEMMKVTENRYSGIPTIIKAMNESGLMPPELLDSRGSFIVKFYKKEATAEEATTGNSAAAIVEFCKTPRSRREIAEFLGLESVSYAISNYVTPLIEEGVIAMTIPEKPSSSKQMFYTAYINRDK